MLAAAGAVFYFAYAFADASPHVSLDTGASTHFTLLFLFGEKIAYIIGAELIALAAVSAGLLATRFLRLGRLPVVERIVLSFGVGLGALSLVTLGLGLSGRLSQGAAIGVLFVFIAIGLEELRGCSRRIIEVEPPRFSVTELALAAVIALGALLTLLYAFNPPMFFDALEYHLGAPAHYFRTGSIRYIEYNVYSNFPANCEMIYLFSMALTGSKFAGAMLGKVINAYVAFAAAGAAYCLGRWLSGRAAGLFAAAALFVSGGFFQVTTGVYVEGLQTLYAILAVLAVGRFVAKGSRGMLIAGAVAAGLAMGVKYPSAIFVAAPLALAVLLRRGKAGERVTSFLLYSLVAAAVVAPWLVKNIIFTGNPVYPLLAGLFGSGSWGRDWSAMQNARWALAHTPKGGLAWEQWARHGFGLFFSNENVTLLAFVFIPFLWVKRLPRRTVYVMAFAALYFFVWLAATHRVDRFTVPGFAVLGALSGAGLFSLYGGRLRGALTAGAVGLAAYGLFYLGALYGHVSGIDPSVPLFGKYDEMLTAKKAGYESWMKVGEIVGPRSKVLLWGEAETFYLDFGWEGTTVFDRKMLDEIAAVDASPAAVAAEMKGRGFSYVFANWMTFKRQQETYRFAFDGEEHEGYSDTVTHELFAGMVREGALEVVYSSGREAYPGTPDFVLYRIR